MTPRTMPLSPPTVPAEPRDTGWPLVSIVTPSYNQARFLRRTVESVLRQDYPHVEYVVIDGGSTDGSPEVLRGYGNRLRWVSEPDRGQSDAINKGFAQCRGEVRAYLNSDDVLWPGAVRTAIEHFRCRPDWDLLYGNAYQIDADDGILGRYPTAPYDLGRLLQNCFICQPAAFWRTRLAERVGPFDADLHYAMDLDYWLRADRAGGRLVHVPEVLACSRVYPETKTLSARDRVYGEILAVCRRHAGQAGFSQYFAYWHHRCREADHGWPRRLRWLPRPETWLALLHARWHRHDGRLLPFGADLLASLGRKLLRRRGLREAGALPDDWLGPGSTIDVAAPQDRVLRLAGSAPKDLQLTVWLDGKARQSVALQAHREELIEMPLPAGCRELRLEFSGHAVDARGRRLSFRVRRCEVEPAA
jgi:hypothetical protein